MNLTREKARPGSNAPPANASVISVLSQFARRLASGDAHGAASLWDVPALILGDTHVHGPLSSDRLAALLEPPGDGAGTPASARERPALTEQHVVHVEWISERVAMVDARWPQMGHEGLLEGIDATTFLVRIDESGTPKIRALLLRSAAATR